MKIKKDNKVRVVADFEVAVICKILPYEKRLQSSSKIINKRMNDFLISQKFPANQEYQISILLADRSMNHIKGITLPRYTELKVSIDTKQSF